MVNNVIGMANEHELLKVIDFSNNRIQEISGKAFHKVSNVEKLILDHNDLSISGKTKPSGLCNIMYLILTSFHFMTFLWYKKNLYNLFFSKGNPSFANSNFKVFTIHTMSGGEQKNGFDLIFFSLKIFTQEFLDKRDINVRQIEIFTEA